MLLWHYFSYVSFNKLQMINCHIRNQTRKSWLINPTEIYCVKLPFEAFNIFKGEFIFSHFYFLLVFVSDPLLNEKLFLSFDLPLWPKLFLLEGSRKEKGLTNGNHKPFDLISQYFWKSLPPKIRPCQHKES